MLLRARRARWSARLDRRLPWPERRAALRRWRRTRPFWAGLLLLLGGAELLLVPLSPLTVLVSLGLGGLAAIGIGLALMAAGLFLWCTPAAHHYVSINALILSVLSFAATNLGGFLVGMGLGIAGGAMGFGWRPVPQGRADDGADEAGDAQCSGRAGARGAAGKALAVALPLALLTALGGPAERAGAAGTGPTAGVPAPSQPPTVTTTRFAPQGFTLAGVTDVPTANGPLKAMVLRMKAAELSDYRLTTHNGGPELRLASDALDLTGDVTLYLTKFSGCLQGVVCLTFTPDTLPVPPVVPPFVYMTRVSAEQALVTSDLIVADGLRLSAEPAGRRGST
ncbi:DUF6114 domain-containing protein [Streptomyces pinistramenti]|uniref:DUF6114 domain-containing protein n=1 Tax=Streptomyces pinistramenti TaxID=2884812 RepID=UPI001D05C6D1|nr:DUF6114 domain-containing protein [Streptomyces pinistramenti]MCB5910741.1 DUF6114 domain-containing protein [Streptomyces pinistramenti]